MHVILSSDHLLERNVELIIPLTIVNLMKCFMYFQTVESRLTSAQSGGSSEDNAVIVSQLVSFVPA